ncbi:MAG TPA: DUF6599 family protein [Terriglobia bacterium]|nr:DUF6599 family protein [Terriglobia bacterium]
MKALMLAAAALAGAMAASAADIPNCSLVPGWEQQGAARTYEADDLFEYMDGNAEGYLIYGFVRMRGVTCASGGDSILIDVSEMTDAESAYGIFTSNLDPARPVEKIGMGGQVQPRRAVFAKDKFYVELAANPDKDHTPALRAFVAEIEKRIAGRTDPPEALSWFPAEKLVSVRLIPESVLGLSALRRGYAAQYEYGKAFVVQEDSAGSAAAVMGKLRKRFDPTRAAQVADEAFKATDKYLGGICFFRKGRFIGGFANLSDDEDGPALARTLAARIP